MLRNSAPQRRLSGLVFAGRRLMLLCVMATATMAQSVPPPAWQRAWTLDGFSCPACGKEDRAWLQASQGKQIVFGPRDFSNPFYESCTGHADYAEIRPRSAAEARDLVVPFRLPALKNKRPLAGRVRCDDVPGRLPNTVALVIIDGDRAYIPHESGALLILR